MATIRETNLGGGIDALSSEDTIPDSYAERLTNVNPTPEGYLTKRPGFITESGWVPFRVQSIKGSVADNELCFALPGSVSLANIRSRLKSTPVIVAGIGTSTDNPDFPAGVYKEQYYDSFDADVRYTIAANAITTITIPQTEHGYTSQDIWAGVSESTTIVSLDSTEIIPDSVTVGNTGTVTVVINNQGPAYEAFVRLKEIEAIAGDSYLATVASASSITITQATHQLTSTNMIAKLWYINGTSYEEVIPDGTTLAPNGDITFTLVSPLAGFYRVQLLRTPLINNISGTVAGWNPILGQGQLTVTFPVTSPFLWVACFLVQGSNRELVIPDSVTVDDTSSEASVTFTNGSPTAGTFQIYWAYGEIPNNTICVTPNDGVISTGFTDPDIQMCLWGLDHSVSYSSYDQREGWTVGLDDYRAEGEEFLVTSLGGNSYKNTAYGIGYSLYASAQAAADFQVGPVFSNTSDPAWRDAGNIRADNIGLFATADSVQWTTGNQVEFRIPLVNAIVPTLSTALANTKLTVEQAPYNELNGNWDIVAYSYSAPDLLLTVEIPGIDSSDWDDIGGGTQVSILSDTIEVTYTSAQNPFSEGDTLVSEAFATGEPLRVTLVNGTFITFDGITSPTQVPIGIRLQARRTSEVLQLRDGSTKVTPAFLVSGDMITIAGVSHKVQAKYFWVEDDDTVTLSGDIITFDTNTTDKIQEGTPLQLTQAGSESGVVRVVSIIDSMSVQVDRTFSATTAVVLGHSVSIDEALTWEDVPTNVPNVTVDTRWEPIELPDSNPLTTQHFPGTFENQSLVSSTKVSASLFETNPDMTPWKIDGRNIYKAGLPPIASLLHIAQDPQATAKIDVSVSSTFAYYARLNVIDRNGFITGSAQLGSEDIRITLAADAAVNLRFQVTPHWAPLDWDRVEIELYRSKANNFATFYRLGIIPVPPLTDGVLYLDYVDSDSDSVIVRESNKDTLSDLKGGELGFGFAPPPQARCLTSTSNRMILGNLKSEMYADLRMVDDTGIRITQASLVGKTVTVTPASGTSTVVEFRNTSTSLTSIVNASGSFTVNTSGATGVVAGQWIYLFRGITDWGTGPSGVDMTHTGWWKVDSILSATSFTVIDPSKTAIGPTALFYVDSVAVGTAASYIPVYIGQDYSYANNATSTAPCESVAAFRAAQAINAAQRSESSPWLLANAGGEYGIGQLILSVPYNAQESFPTVAVGAFPLTFNMYVNGARLTSASPTSFQRDVMASRLVVSYPNFVEIFDNPFADSAVYSDSVIDINPADGQEITGIIPFFGESAFGAAQKDGTLVVFKTNSVYLVQLLSTDGLYLPRVQRLETNGIGCTAPSSISPTRNGIMFANTQGIYKLTRDLQAYEIGRRLRRILSDETNLNTDLLFGHNAITSTSYKLTTPVKGEVAPSQSFVYNFTREYTADGYRDGSWTMHNGVQDFLWWTNTSLNSFAGTTRGRVLGVRTAGDSSDYRDEASPIAAAILWRAWDFGTQSIRKIVNTAVMAFRNPIGSVRQAGTRVYSALNWSTSFEEADRVVLPNRQNTDGISDTSASVIQANRWSFHNRSGVAFQLKITNDAADEPFELTSISLDVDGLSAQGIQEAASTTFNK